MSVDYRMRRIRNIIKRFDKKEASNIGDLVAAFDAIKAEVAIYETVRLRNEKELIE
jgi:hypothetical protein